MYEIWLAMNIVYEIALGVWPLLALLLAVWLGLLVAARGRLGGRQVRQAALLGALVAVALFFSVPTLTQSSLANMGYWVDWANLLAIALGLGALAAVFSVPLLGLAGGRR
jgi:hypothetical protein